jgi:hypothetical protein
MIRQGEEEEMTEQTEITEQTEKIMIDVFRLFRYLFFPHGRIFKIRNQVVRIWLRTGFAAGNRRMDKG